jgi:multidrug resistance efflux pump
VEVSVASELAGRVAEVYVEEGDSVEAGDPLFRLDETLIAAQRDRAAAAVDSARLASQMADAAVASAELQMELALQTARLQAAPSRQLAWRQFTPFEFDLPIWYFEPSEEIEAAEAEEHAAGVALGVASEQLSSLLRSLGLVDEEERVALAQAAFEVAESVLAQAQAANENEAVLDEAEALREAAEAELEAANEAYDVALDDEAADEVLAARAVVAVARSRLETAHERLASLRTGDESLPVRVAQAALAQAQAARDHAAGVLAQAQAELALVEAQMDRLTIQAPIAGVVVTRSVEPGEVVIAGGVVMAIGDLQRLTITTYIPESRYGEIALGASATVTVDSFPGETFRAEVVRIADQAEFTPRNVQTEEGRRTTVFAVELSVENPEGKLKPGMPADVVFGQE